MWFSSVLTCAVIGFFIYFILKIMKKGSFLFRIGYFLYTRTRLGYIYHRRDVDKANRKYPDGHSVVKPVEFGDLTIIPIPMVMDNYSYIVHEKSTGTSIIVDPSVPEAVQPVLDSFNLQLTAILTTHKHWDHSGGNQKLVQQHRGLQVYGGSQDHVSAGTHRVNDGDVLQFGNLKFTVLFTPGHTVGHVVYLLDGTPFGLPDSLFTGDLLFVGGVGRMFECSPSVMLTSLDKVCTLADSTLLWPVLSKYWEHVEGMSCMYAGDICHVGFKFVNNGHEYGQDNLEFAASVDADNSQLQEKYNWVLTRRKVNLVAVPSTIGEEKSYNPFLRTHHNDILQAVGLDLEKFETEGEKQTTRSRALAQLRVRKDKFKYKL